MGRNTGAGIAGILVAIAVVWLVETIGHMVYPPPLDLDFSDTQSMRAYVDALPMGALLFVIAAWFIGTLCGTCVACAIGVARPANFALVVGGLLLIATAINLAMIPHPLWFSILGITGVIAGAWLGMMCKRGSTGHTE